MEKQFQEISANQKASWNKFSPGWKKWDVELNNHMQPASNGIIELLNPNGSQLILDIAAGTGEPGLSIAGMVQNGKVIITDLSEGMLDIARENAKNKGISNVDFQACDVCELPFASNTIDGVSCRMGFMFFPDMLLAAKEILRVLKPGGRIATSVWNTPDKNVWVTAIAETINRKLQSSPPPPGAPGIFRCSKSGLMTNIFIEAGFENVSESEVSCTLKCESTDIYWRMMTEIAAPVVAALGKADDAMKEKIKSEVYELVNEMFPNGNAIMPGSALLIYGEKQA